MRTATTATYTLVIPRYLVPTTNQLFRGTLRRRMRLGRECRELVAGYFAGSGIPRAEGRRRVSLRLTLGPRNRPRDVDSSWKAALDACVRCGALVDDSPAWCELGTFEAVRGPEPATAIVLEDLGPGVQAAPRPRRGVRGGRLV